MSVTNGIERFVLLSSFSFEFLEVDKLSRTKSSYCWYHSQTLYVYDHQEPFPIGILLKEFSIVIIVFNKHKKKKLLKCLSLI